jgi:hypothetical protein
MKTVPEMRSGREPWQPALGAYPVRWGKAVALSGSFVK